MTTLIRWVLILAALTCGATASGAEQARLHVESARADGAAFDSGVGYRDGVLAISSVAAQVGRAAPPASAKSVANPGSLSGLWYNPAQDGHGFSLSFNASGSVAIAWYVYQNGQQAYLVGAGTLSGNRAVVPVVITSGTGFPPAGFSASAVQRTNWGTITIDVLSCSSIRASWSPQLAGFSTGSLDLQPLIVAGGAPCSVTTDVGDDYGNTCATAVNVLANGATSGHIETGSDVDFLKVTLGSAGTLTLTSGSLTDSLDPIGTLYDSGCNQIASDDDGAGIPNFRISRVLGAGAYYLRVSSFNGTTGGYVVTESFAPSSTQTTVTLAFDNKLIYAVDFTVNNQATYRVGARSTQQQTVSISGGLDVTFALVGATTSGGTPIGDLQNGFYNTVSSPSGTIQYTLAYQIGSSSYFAPLISNQTSSTILIGANMGLQSENRCNCTSPGFSTNVSFGYYRLFSNSNVRGYRSGSGYTGSYIYWGADSSGTTNPIPNLITDQSGAVQLNATSAP